MRHDVLEGLLSPRQGAVGKHKVQATTPKPSARNGSSAEEVVLARASCTALLAKALCDNGVFDASEGLAEDVEHELFKLHNGQVPKEYKAAARSLAVNIKRNTQLRQRLVSGEVAPSSLVRMGAHELATSEQREVVQKMQERNLFMSTIVAEDVSAAVRTNEYRCAQCDGTTCDYVEAGRRDIGKCETWGSKDDDATGNRLVTCLTCGARWQVSGLA